MIRKHVQGMLALALMSSLGLRADDFKFKNGRLAEEKVIELELTADQAESVVGHFKPGMSIQLSPSQRAEIRAKAHAKEVPTTLELWKPGDLEGECSCFLWNIGLVFKPGRLELPVSRIVSDQEAKDRQPDPNG